MSFRWNEDTMLKFVNLYKSERCLWDTSCGSYKNNVDRMESLKKIVKTMNVADFGIMECKNKIKNLRSAYCQELKKIKKATMKGTTYTPTVAWFNLLHLFLNNFITQQKDLSVKTEPDNDVSECEPPPRKRSVKQCIRMSTESDEETLSFLASEPKNVKYDDSSSITAEILTSNANNTTTSHTIGEESVTTITAFEENEFDIFSRNVAAQLKRMPIRKALMAQLKIHTVLMEMRLADE